MGRIISLSTEADVAQPEKAFPFAPLTFPEI
jgi:hypothetical protein